MNKPADGGAPVVDNANELQRAAQELTQGWVKQTTPPAGETPPPEPQAPPPTPDATPAGTPPAPPAEAPAPGASAEEVSEFIEAIIREAQGETPAEVLKIPRAARIPIVQDGKTIYRPASEALTSGMLEADYTRKTQEVANARRQLEQHAANLVADRARVEARQRWIEEEQTRLREAQQDPAKWEAYQNHLRLMQEDPEYARTFADALVGRERQAMDKADEAALHVEVVREAVGQAADWILEIGNEEKFQGVDLDQVRLRYAAALEHEQAALDPSFVRRIFEDEARHLTSSPDLMKEVADLRAQVAALKGTDSAAAHNRATEHVLKRAAAPPVVTGQPAAPAAPDRKVKPFTPRELPEVNAAWAARRD